MWYALLLLLPWALHAGYATVTFDAEGRPTAITEGTTTHTITSHAVWDPARQQELTTTTITGPNGTFEITVDPEGKPLQSRSVLAKQLDGFLHGCKSLQQRAGAAIQTIADRIVGTLTLAQRQLGLWDDFRAPFEDVAFRVIRQHFWTLIGYNPDPMHAGTVGTRWVSDSMRVTHINGILSAFPSMVDNAGFFSETHGGAIVHYVYAETKGFSADVLRCILVKVGFCSPQARLLAATWRSLLQEMRATCDNPRILHYAHSLGGSDTARALSLLTEEERNCIRVITLGSATLLPNSNATNYISNKDAIPLFDPIGYLRGWRGDQSNVVFLDSLLPIPGSDHLINSPTYSAAIEALGQQFQQEQLNGKR